MHKYFLNQKHGVAICVFSDGRVIEFVEIKSVEEKPEPSGNSQKRSYKKRDKKVGTTVPDFDEEDVPINLSLQPTALPAIVSEDVQEYGGIGEITAAPSSVLPTGTIRRRPTRMKFKGCGVRGNKLVFIANEHIEKYNDDIVESSLFLEGTINSIPNVQKNMFDYIVAWNTNGTLPVMFDMNHLRTKFFKGDSQQMILLRESRKMYDMEHPELDGIGPHDSAQNLRPTSITSRRPGLNRESSNMDNSHALYNSQQAVESTLTTLRMRSGYLEGNASNHVNNGNSTMTPNMNAFDSLSDDGSDCLMKTITLL